MRRRGWFGFGRRLFLKARFGVQQLRGRMRDRRAARARMLPLDQVHRRLELLLTAVYGRSIPIAPLDPPRWTGPNARELARRAFRGGAPIASVDGDAIYLPPELAEQDDVAALTRYRLIALEQAERMIRGTTEQALPTDELERDLYLLREGAAIDAHIAQHHRGVADLLHRERSKALARRPKIDNMTLAERDVESRLRDMLAARPEELESPSPNPAASLQWARDTARSIRSLGAKYRGLPLTPIWGTVKAKAATPIVSSDDTKQNDSNTLRPRVGSPESLTSAARSGESPEESKKQSKGSGQDTAPAEDPQGKQDAKESKSDSTDDKQEGSGADQQQSGGSSADVWTAVGSQLEHLPPPIYYDEWDADHCKYLHRRAAVRLYDCGDADETWIRGALAEHAATSRRIRHQFERLRARRALLRRQRSGDELDIAACVNAIVDRRLGHSGEERLYIDARPARRGLAIALLVDVSGSTGVRVTEAMRIIDLERIALLLAGEALDALGDLYAVYSFCGREASNIKLSVIKEFTEQNSYTVHRRIAAMEPEGFTRLGAAIRHATTQLARQSAGHRLLLILSDGRPNDIDRYQGSYGVEDSRQAVLEARASGVFPFCLTIDAEASEYLPRIFGKAGHTILQRPEHLPKALLGVVRGLIGRA